MAHIEKHSEVCACRSCRERDAKKPLAGDWLDEPWSTWLPDMIKADYWDYSERSDLNAAALLTKGDSKLEYSSIYSQRYFCTFCPRKGLLPRELLASHASHVTIGVSRLGNCMGVLHDELKTFLDVSEVKQWRGSDGQSYVLLRSRTMPHRRTKSQDEITCSDCMIVKTMNRRNILTTFCSVECQFSSRLSPDAAVLFALRAPREPNVHHYLDYNFARLGIDAPDPKRPRITTSMAIDEDHNRPTYRSPHTTCDAVHLAPQFIQFPIVAMQSMHISYIDCGNSHVQP